MVQKVVIAVINESSQGVSSTTGLAWKRQDIVVTWVEHSETGNARTQYLQGTLRGESVDLFEHSDYKVGDTIEVDIEFMTKSYNQRVHNDVTFKLYK